MKYSNDNNISSSQVVLSALLAFATARPSGIHVAAPAVAAYAAPAVATYSAPAVAAYAAPAVAAPAVAAYAAPAAAVVQAPVATAITKHVHYASTPVVTGYTSQVSIKHHFKNHTFNLNPKIHLKNSFRTFTESETYSYIVLIPAFISVIFLRFYIFHPIVLYRQLNIQSKKCTLPISENH